MFAPTAVQPAILPLLSVAVPGGDDTTGTEDSGQWADRTPMGEALRNPGSPLVDVFDIEEPGRGDGGVGPR